MAGFSRHAGVAARANGREKLERLCRTLSRPAVSEPRLSLSANGNLRYQPETPCRDAATQVVFEPLDMLARLAAPVPRPRVNPSRYHGVFAPSSPHRAVVTKAGRGGGTRDQAAAQPEYGTLAERRAPMRWAQRLKPQQPGMGAYAGAFFIHDQPWHGEREILLPVPERTALDDCQRRSEAFAYT